MQNNLLPGMSPRSIDDDIVPDDHDHDEACNCSDVYEIDFEPVLDY